MRLSPARRGTGRCRSRAEGRRVGMSNGNKKLFLSAVSSEFVSYHAALRRSQAAPTSMSPCRRTSSSPVAARWRRSTTTSGTATASCTSSAMPAGPCPKTLPSPPCSRNIRLRTAPAAARRRSPPAAAGVFLHAMGGLPGALSPAPAFRLSPHGFRERCASRVAR